MSEFQEGVFFDMSAEDYHAVPALSASGIRRLTQSPLDFWVRSPWNPNQAAALAEEGGDSEALTIGQAFHARIVEGFDAFAARYAPEIVPENYPGALRTVDDLKAWLRDRNKAVSGNKADLITRVHETDPAVQIWDIIESAYAQANEGRHLLSPKWWHKIGLAAAMIEGDPTFRKAFSGGAAEVSIFWTCPITGVPCKARVDYLKARAVVDLKSFRAEEGLPLRQSAFRAIARYGYHIPAAFYLEGVSHVAAFLGNGQTDQSPSFELSKTLLADHPKDWLWVFQSKGIAPATVGLKMPPQGMILEAAKARIEAAKQTFKQCLDTFASGEPWCAPAGIEMVQDGDLPPWGL